MVLKCFEFNVLLTWMKFHCDILLYTDGLCGENRFGIVDDNINDRRNSSEKSFMKIGSIDLLLLYTY